MMLRTILIRVVLILASTDAEEEVNRTAPVRKANVTRGLWTSY